MKTKITVDKILDYYDEPILFVGRDEYDTMYLCLIGNEDVKYIAMKISRNDLDKLTSGKIDVRGLFASNVKASTYDVVEEAGELFMDTSEGKDYEDLLPEDGYTIAAEPSQSYTVKIPDSDRGLFKSIVHRFGWIAM